MLKRGVCVKGGFALKGQKSSGWKDKWCFAVTPWNLFLIAISIFINYAGRFFADYFSLPFWLDTVGTLVVAIRLGPLAAAFSAAITNFYFGLNDLTSLMYTIVGVGIGICVGYFFPRGRKREAFPVIATAVLSGLVAVILSTPLNVIFYEGYTGNIWGDGLIDMLAPYLEGVVVKCFLGEAFVDIPDKALSVILAIAILSAADFVRALKGKGKRTAAVLLFVLAGSLSPVLSVGAVDFAADYAGVNYDTRDGTTAISGLGRIPGFIVMTVPPFPRWFSMKK